MANKPKDLAGLQIKLALLKKEEKRLRYLSTSVRSSPEYRREAVAKLEETRRRIHSINIEIINDETPAED